MKNFIRKQVGKSKSTNPLKQLKMINDSLKKLGCDSNKKIDLSNYRKVVGHK